MKWSFYNASTGDFVDPGVECTMDELVGNTPEGLVAIGGEYLHQQDRFDFESNAVAAYIPAPQDSYEFTWVLGVGGRWLPITSMQVHRDEKWDVIKDLRDLSFESPLVTPYGVFDQHTDARRNIADAVLLSSTASDRGRPINIEFTLLNNNTVLLDLTAISNVGLMMGGKVQSARRVATELRNRIKAAALPDDLEQINWPT